MTQSAIPDYPQEDGQNKALQFMKEFAKASTGVIPGFGPYIAATIELYFKLPLEQRREEWMDQVVDALREIEEKLDSQSVAALPKNEEFVTLLHRATETAVRTHVVEKRHLLRNAVVSGALPDPPAFERQLYFLRLIDELSVNQVLVLILYADPMGWFKKRNRTPTEHTAGSAMRVLEQAYPQIFKDPYVKEVVLTGLESRGLLSGLTGMVTGGSIYAQRTSKLGLEFLKYLRADSVLD